MASTPTSHGEASVAASRPCAVQFSISIVSHRSGKLLATLLEDLQRLQLESYEVILTLNVPEDETFLARFSGLRPTVLRNERPRGFGDNHNRAHAVSRGVLFVVVNPDIRLPRSPFAALAMASLQEGVGTSAPVVRSPQGAVEDSVRRFPTFGRLAKRLLLGKRTPDYSVEGQSPLPIDWAGGMFLMFKRESFASVGGFDTRYFMYLEDADICRRLWAKGLSVVLVPTVEVVHDAQRKSRRDMQHLRWHLRSATRFLFGM